MFAFFKYDLCFFNEYRDNRYLYVPYLCIDKKNKDIQAFIRINQKHFECDNSHDLEKINTYIIKERISNSNSNYINLQIYGYDGIVYYYEIENDEELKIKDLQKIYDLISKESNMKYLSRLSSTSQFHGENNFVKSEEKICFDDLIKHIEKLTDVEKQKIKKFINDI